MALPWFRPDPEGIFSLNVSEPGFERRRPPPTHRPVLRPVREEIVIVQDNKAPRNARNLARRRLEAEVTRVETSTTAVHTIHERSPNKQVHFELVEPPRNARKYHDSHVVIHEASPRLRRRNTESARNRLSIAVEEVDMGLRLPPGEAPLQLPPPQPYPVFMERAQPLPPPIVIERSQSPPSPNLVERKRRSPRIELPPEEYWNTPPPAPEAPAARPPPILRQTPPPPPAPPAPAPERRRSERRRSPREEVEETRTRPLERWEELDANGNVTTVTRKTTVYTTYHQDGEDDSERRRRRERRDRRSERREQEPGQGRSRSPNVTKELLLEAPVRMRETDFGRLFDDRGEGERRRRMKYLYT